MDLSTHAWLYSGTVGGYLAALGVVVGAIVFGALIVRPWSTRPRDPGR
jgi:hypothetical protein